jgi:membrane protein DedA with SNARE-associated domain
VNVDHLIREYGCAMVFAAAALQAVGVPVPGTTALIAAALYAANTHGLPIVGVIAAGAGGAMLGTSIGYAIGRRGGERLLTRLGRRLRQPPERVERWRALVGAHSGKLVVFGRFVTGLRNLAGLLAGAGGMAPRRFLALSALGAVLWATSAGLEYYYFGKALAGAGTWIQVGLIALGLVWAVISIRYLRRRIINVTT